MRRMASESQNRATLSRSPRFETVPGVAERVPELDSLRGLAALTVVLFHTNAFQIPAGWAAVDLFFVLSGYLITAIVLRHGATPGFLPRFYLRRGLRVWPAYYLLVGIVALLVPYLFRPYWWNGLPYLLTFTQGLRLYWTDTSPVFTVYLGHTWTLAVEEQFYLLWPAVLLALRLNRRRVAVLAILCVAISASARSHGLTQMVLGGRGDGLALGALLAVMLSTPNFQRYGGRLTLSFSLCAASAFAVLLALALTVGITSRTHQAPWPGVTILAFNVLFFGVIGLTVGQSGRRWLAPLRSTFLRRMGMISFGLYLYHMPILLLFHDVARTFGPLGKPLRRELPALGACFAVAWLSWRHLEEPILRLKNRLEYRTRELPGHHLRMHQTNSRLLAHR